jgi:hypothetical protein
MKLLDLIRAHWNIWGLDDPTFGRIPAIGLLFVPLCVLSYLPWGVRRESNRLAGVTAKIGHLWCRMPSNPRRGVASTTCREPAEILDMFLNLANAWNCYLLLVVAGRARRGEG